jgi:hypothetical protein
VNNLSMTLLDMRLINCSTAIFKILLRDEALAEDVNIDDFARKTDGFSGSDLKRQWFFSVLLPSNACVLIRGV